MNTYQQLPPEEKYIPRDLSWLAFNARVLAEAELTGNPLLERLKFMAIFVKNLDEFFMVRVAGLKRLVDSGYNHKTVFGYYPHDLFEQIKKTVAVLQAKLYALWQSDIAAQLIANRIIISSYEALNPEQKKFVRSYFFSTLLPVITPLAVDPGRPFPLLATKTIALAALVVREHQQHLAIIPLPRNLPRFIKLPAGVNEYRFIFIEDILRHFAGHCFRGYELRVTAQFRLLRDSAVTADEDIDEEDESLMRVVEESLRQRARGSVCALELSGECPPALREWLLSELAYPAADVGLIPGPLDLSCLFELAALPVAPLRYPAYVPPPRQYENIFDTMKEGAFIVHLPYESFQPTVDLLTVAAHDPDVLAIKMTLYRTDEHSRIIQALKYAADHDKQVTVLVEIKARFDEELNIQWVRELEEAGCHVMYGIPGMKVHAKMMLIVRREEGRIRRYVHLSTGNYNEKTAAVYTDIGYFTGNDDFAHDIAAMFNVITGYSLPPPWRRIVASPHDMRNFFFNLIDREIENQRQFGNGMLRAQMNSLEDVRIIDKLYEASAQGVQIDLVVRGICCLIPGVPGMSEHIRVKSVVGRFLEHARILMVNNNGEARFFISSADWMRRNLERRVELLFELYRTELKEQLRFIIESYWRDTDKSWMLQPDRAYCRDNGGAAFNVQEFFIQHYAGI